MALSNVGPKRKARVIAGDKGDCCKRNRCPTRHTLEVEGFLSKAAKSVVM